MAKYFVHIRTKYLTKSEPPEDEVDAISSSLERGCVRDSLASSALFSCGPRGRGGLCVGSLLSWSVASRFGR